jgi:hypothetical protein
MHQGHGQPGGPKVRVKAGALEIRAVSCCAIARLRLTETDLIPPPDGPNLIN